MSFPRDLREEVRRWALTPFSNPVPDDDEDDDDYRRVPNAAEEGAMRSAMDLGAHAGGEFVRLLTIARMVEERQCQQDRETIDVVSIHEGLSPGCEGIAMMADVLVLLGKGTAEEGGILQ